MKKPPEIFRHTAILTNWRGYPAGSVERAKALGIDLMATSANLEATIELWESKLRLLDCEKPWETLGLKSRDDFVLAATGRSDKEVRKQITKTAAIRERREKFPNETQGETAAAVKCSRQLVTKVVATKSSQCEEKVAVPDWVTRPVERAAFRKLPPEEQERLAALKEGDCRGAVRRAAIAAGIIKVPTTVEKFLKLWQKASSTEREKIRTFCNTTD